VPGTEHSNGTEPAESTERADTGLSHRGLRTRQAILDASKRLFLERGYAGTWISSITEACGISRAGFYTYFRDKREIFNVIGETTYRELLEVIGALDAVPRPSTRQDVEAWVRTYFAFMDEHGAFMLSAQSAPGDEDVRVAGNRLRMRAVFLLGAALRARQRTPTEAPEALGLTTQVMLERSWYDVHAEHLPIDEADVVRTIADYLTAMLDA
jgi:AcrR family transcriptional regulator